MGLAGSAAVVFKYSWDNTQQGLVQQQSEMNKRLKADITIEVMSYNLEDDQFIAYIKNTGQAQIDPSRVDVYIDSIIIPRTNRSAQVTEDTDTKNIGVWDPGEILKIQANHTLEEAKTYKVIITTHVGARDEGLIGV